MSTARSTPLDCTVVIPTRARHAKLERCLRSLNALETDSFTHEVLVSVDGPDTGESQIVRACGSDAKVIEGIEGGGPGLARNRALKQARGEVLLLLNDDVIVDPELVSEHLRAHQGRTSGTPAMVLGAAPWEVHHPDRLFDRLIRETSMVFFYDQMTDTDPDRDWGFRHAWTLNLSLPTSVARAVGGFCEDLPHASFEDLEWAWRVHQRFCSPVLYRPGAVVTHDHRYEPADYLRREHRLGRDAWALAGANAACARDVFGRDLRTEDEINECRSFIEEHRDVVEQLERTFCQLAERASSDADAGEVYQHHLPLKRWHWRRGLLEAASMDPEFGELLGEPTHAA